MNSRSRWVAYTGEPDRDGRPDKQPINPHSGRKASSTNPATWGTRAQADAQALLFAETGWKPGVGIVLGNGLAGVDLDGCIVNGVLLPWAAEILDVLNTYSEISQSGQGVKAFFRIEELNAVRAELTLLHKREWKLGPHFGVELHLSNSYFAVTGRQYGDGLAGDYLRLVSTEELIEVATIAERFRGKPRDESGSGIAFRFCLDLASYGLSADEIEADLRANRGPAGEWAARVDDRQIQRCVRRALEQFRAAENDRRSETMGRFTAGLEDEPSYLSSVDEDGAIRAFAKKYVGELVFDHHIGKWHRFVGYWRPEETKLALHYARSEAVELAHGDAKNKALRRVAAWEAIERGARSDRVFAVTSDLWNRDQLLLGTPSGTVDLRSGELRAGRAEDYICRATAVSPLPLSQFIPEQDCPRWLSFLKEALNEDGSAIRFLQQWGGYSLTGETKEQKLVFVYGPGGSGKGTAINTIADILGDYAVNVGMETLTASRHERHTTELARLRGARMARASETEKGKAWAENRIKSLTGQDTITARFMRQDDFEFVPEFKLTIFGNSRPSLRDVDTAIKRRFLILPFDNQPAHRDPELPEKLKAEWPGILSWLILGSLDWQANGLIIPPVMDAATQAYFDAEDTFGQWLSDCCETGPKCADTSESLWQSWSRYAHQLGEDPGSKKGSFAETLCQRGFLPGEKIGPSRKRGYKGVRVREDASAFGDGFI